MSRRPHREICSICHEVNRVGFHVPNDVWELATHFSQRESIICTRCFTRMADERGVEWDRDITFYPNSWVKHQNVAIESPQKSSKDIESQTIDSVIKIVEGMEFIYDTGEDEPIEDRLGGQDEINSIWDDFREQLLRTIRVKVVENKDKEG